MENSIDNSTNIEDNKLSIYASKPSDIVATAVARYRYSNGSDISDLSMDEIRLQVGRCCIDIAQDLMHILSIFNDKFTVINADQNINEEIDEFFRSSTFSIASLIDEIQNYQDMAKICGITDEIAEGMINKKIEYYTTDHIS